MKEAPKIGREVLESSLMKAEQALAAKDKELDHVKTMHDGLRASIQSCRAGHNYIDPSAKYPCPWCALAAANEQIEQLRQA